MLLTGGSQQAPEWIAQNGDGWMIYPRNVVLQTQIIQRWRESVAAAGSPAKPVMQPLYVDLTDAEVTPERIHLGLRLGPRALVQHLKRLGKIGVNHVALNLRFNKADVEDTLKRLAAEVLPELGRGGTR